MFQTQKLIKLMKIFFLPKTTIEKKKSFIHFHRLSLSILTRVKLFLSLFSSFQLPLNESSKSSFWRLLGNKQKKRIYIAFACRVDKQFFPSLSVCNSTIKSALRYQLKDENLMNIQAQNKHTRLNLSGVSGYAIDFYT